MLFICYEIQTSHYRLAFKVEGIAMKATLAQGNQIINLILQHDVDTRLLQKLLESGLLPDLLQGSVDQVDRAQFRELLGLEPDPSKANRKYTTNPLVRYPWLSRKLGLTAMDLRVEDNVRGASMHISQTAPKKLKVYSLKKASAENLKPRAMDLIHAHNVYECQVLDERGQTIGTLTRPGTEDPLASGRNWNFQFADARFLAFTGADDGWTVILYEIDAS